MTLADVLLHIALVDGALLAAATLLIVGWTRFRTALGDARRRLLAVLPYLGVLAAVLVVNRVARQVGPQVSWIIGVNITGTIYAIEGTFVAWLQSFATPALTAYFSGVYIYGYVFLLVFPIVAYFALDELTPLRRIVLAYAVNYGVGLACYIVFIAYGPRNFLPDLVESMLYTTWPQSQFLTSQVNTNTNVFPSLHTSLSVTVALLSLRTRDAYPLWTLVAVPLAASVVVSTMYLGIHWATDVVGGVVLGVGSVLVADRLDESTAATRWRDAAIDWLRERVSYARR